MASVGIRELRQRASELVRLVEGGKTIEITDRGRPVALLTPLPAAGPLDRLRSSGEIDSAIGSIVELPEPLPLQPGQESPTRALDRVRRRER
jgi:prevent-host-death family protein